MKRLWRLLLAALLLPACARAEWYTFTAGTVPAELAATAMTVCEYSGEMTVSFLGDCTLGGESGTANAKNGFVQTVKREGYAYPFANLSELLTADDVTVANFEGVLTDRKLKKVKKQYNFKGPTDFAHILTLGGVDAVTLANNHSRDYGAKGYADTREALESAGVAAFDWQHVAVWEREGVRIGFTGSVFSLSDGARETLEKQVQLLRDLGCQIVIHSMHAGVEYSDTPTSQPRTVAGHAAKAGVDLVVGHHPHVVHGMETVSGVPVVYSLGNAVFGGNLRPRDTDALLLQAVFAFDKGQAQSMRLVFRPMSISGQEGCNDFCPVLLTGEKAQRVMDRLERSTGAKLPAFLEGVGAVTDTIPLSGGSAP